MVERRRQCQNDHPESEEVYLYPEFENIRTRVYAYNYIYLYIPPVAEKIKRQFPKDEFSLVRCRQTISKACD